MHLLTLKDTGSSYLARLAHLYQEGEDPSLSRPTTENLNAVLQLLQYQEIRELSLSANQLRTNMQLHRLQFQAGDSLSNLPTSKAGSRDAGLETLSSEDGRNGELLVPLQPMEVRTFELLYRPN